jgi:hypothetical protein
LEPNVSLRRWVFLLALGCAQQAVPAASVAVMNGTVPPGDALPPEPPPRPLAPLTAEEQKLRGQLEKEVGAITELGPRSLAHTWNLYSATDHLARRLEVQGHQVTRLGFQVGDEVLQNLEVVLPGKSPQTLLVAAHYDTSAESPGANASASGAAVLLALAQELVGRQLELSLRMVWLCNETGSPRGSALYARHIQQAQVPVIATLTLGSLGYFSESAGSQKYPDDVLYGSEKRTHFANFIAVLSNAGSNGLLEHVRPVLAGASLPVEELILPDDSPLAAEGAQARFWSAGLLGLALTDTAQFRSPHYDDALDTADKLDFDRLARVARLLEQLVMSIAGPLVPRAG